MKVCRTKPGAVVHAARWRHTWLCTGWALAHVVSVSLASESDAEAAPLVPLSPLCKGCSLMSPPAAPCLASLLGLPPCNVVVLNASLEWQHGFCVIDSFLADS